MNLKLIVIECEIEWIEIRAHVENTTGKYFCN